MKNCGAWACILLAFAGCQRRTYEIDFSEVQGFEWNGKMRITKSERGRLGPLLTLEKEWNVDSVELGSRDGQSAFVKMNGMDEVPIASVGPGVPQDTNLDVLGTRTVSQSMGGVLIADPEAVAAALSNPTTRPASPRPIIVRMAPSELKPYANHVDQLQLIDWWAIAATEAREVTVQYRVPNEQLVITLRGEPDKYGPAVLEVAREDGTLLKRFERTQVPTKPLRDQSR